MFVLLVPAVAFPPSPYFTIYGIVRDQVGQRLPANGTSFVVLLKGTTEISRTPITTSQIDQNYELQIRIDANRSGTELYRETAFAADSQLNVIVELNGVQFYPIEVAGDLRIGNGGERLKLDLNLGEDKDLDGLPDTWEEWQLYQAGLLPDTNGEWDLSLLSRNGDFDHDGQSDGVEYIAGTFAGDATESFALEITDYRDGVAHFEFYQIIGKVYTLETSPDAATWQRVEFAVGAGASGISYKAGGIGIKAASTASAPSKALFRLNVR